MREEPVKEKKKFEKSEDQEPLSEKKKKRETKNGEEEKKVEVKLEKGKLFIKNLSDTAEEEDLESVFMRVIPDLKILSIRVVRDEDAHKRGIAFMDLETKEMAERAMKLNNYNIKGQAIKVYLSRPPSE